MVYKLVINKFVTIAIKLLLFTSSKTHLTVGGHVLLIFALESSCITRDDLNRKKQPLLQNILA